MKRFRRSALILNISDIVLMLVWNIARAQSPQFGRGRGPAPGNYAYSFRIALQEPWFPDLFWAGSSHPITPAPPKFVMDLNY